MRRTWVAILAGTELFFACCFLLSSSTFIEPGSWRRDTIDFTIAWGSLFLLAASLLIVSAVGLLFHKQWARILTLALACFFLAAGFVLLLTSIFVDVEEFVTLILAPYMPSWAVICFIDSLLCIGGSGMALIILLPKKSQGLFR
jgi:hypothetical protein